VESTGRSRSEALGGERSRIRGDTDFSHTEQVGNRWKAEGVKFILGMDGATKLVALAEGLGGGGLAAVGARAQSRDPDRAAAQGHALQGAGVIQREFENKKLVGSRWPRSSIGRTTAARPTG